MLEQPLFPGDVGISGRKTLGVGDATFGVAGKVVRLAATGTATDEVTLEIWSEEIEVRTGSRPVEAVTGTEHSRVEAGAEMLSEAAV